MGKTRNKRIQTFYNCFNRQDTVLVAINADPDAIASALAIKRLLWRKVASVTISNINIVERPDNLAMIKYVSADMIHLKKIRCAEFTKKVIVDSQPDHSELFENLKPDIVIDHHPLTSFCALYSDVRPQYGACASIMTEYLRAARITPSIKLATALFHAIKVDTKNFERNAGSEDLRAFRYLYKYANTNLSGKIENSEIKSSYLHFFSSALNEKMLSKSRIFSHLGKVPNPDVCVLIADFFMKIDLVDWTFISGIYNDKLIIISRSHGYYRNAGKTITKAFKALGSAGGHKSMARAEISLSELPPQLKISSIKSVQKWVKNRIEKTK